MDQAPNQPSPDGGLPSPIAKTTGLSPTVAAWEAYYKEASRRRRAAGGDRYIRVEKRRRQWRERIGIGLSALFVGALTLIFYLVLR
jgi:hypothetical protein